MLPHLTHLAGLDEARFSAAADFSQWLVGVGMSLLCIHTAKRGHGGGGGSPTAQRWSRHSTQPERQIACKGCSEAGEDTIHHKCYNVHVLSSMCTQAFLQMS